MKNIKKDLSLKNNENMHKVPSDVRKVLALEHSVKNMWKDITPLARNEWICWIESAKKKGTRDRRIKIMCENLVAGKRRPCCWAGCPHRV